MVWCTPFWQQLAFQFPFWELEQSCQEFHFQLRNLLTRALGSLTALQIEISWIDNAVMHPHLCSCKYCFPLRVKNSTILLSSIDSLNISFACYNNCCLLSYVSQYRSIIGFGSMLESPWNSLLMQVLMHWWWNHWRQRI